MSVAALISTSPSASATQTASMMVDKSASPSASASAVAHGSTLGPSESVATTASAEKEPNGRGEGEGEGENMEGDMMQPSTEAEESIEGEESAELEESAEAVPTAEEAGAVDEDGENSDDQQEDGEEQGSTERACFPADATVQLDDGRSVRMDELRAGDAVRSGALGATTSVVMFTHADARARAEFVRIELEGGGEVRASGGHFVYANGALVRAREVRCGDWMEGLDGARRKVGRVGRATGSGLYNPQTRSGELVVDGVRVSCYTEAVAPAPAHALLTPVRALGALIGCISW